MDISRTFSLIGWTPAPGGRKVHQGEKSTRRMLRRAGAWNHEVFAINGVTVWTPMACRLLSRKAMKTNQQKGGTS